MTPPRRRQSSLLGSVLLILCIQLSLATESNAESSADKEGASTNLPVHDESTDDPNKALSASCGIWLAPSFIEGSGLGMYAGRNYSKEEEFQTVGDIVIPIVDVNRHATIYSTAPWKLLWHEYTWSARSLGMNYADNVGVEAASPGFGSAANCFIDLINVDELNPQFDMTGLHRSKDPGAAAFSPYYNRKSKTRRDIQAGAELFVGYGDHWFRGRPGMVTVPLSGDLQRATELAQSLLARQEQFPDLRADILWDTFVTKSAWKNTSRVFGSFHHDDIKNELEMIKNNMTLTEIRIEQSTRTLEWLEKHGTCADHIMAGNSTIEQAAHGAFAARNLPAGVVVSQIPLIHIPDRNRLNMYELTQDQCKTSFAAFPPDQCPTQEPKVRIGYQLLLNYCFGHRESSLVLCPYGPMVPYINHNATLANVKIQWADPERGNHVPELLNQPVEHLETYYTSKLAFELVALRDIEKGEEIFLDYGTEWEQAWLEHVRQWKPYQEDQWSAVSLNADLTTPIRTVFNALNGTHYPANLEILCDKFMAPKNQGYWIDLLDKIVSYFEPKQTKLLACQILRHRFFKGKVRYTVLLFGDGEEKFFYEDFPREGIIFRERPAVTDAFFPDAFRHDIRVPDEIFPVTWRNANFLKKNGV